MGKGAEATATNGLKGVTKPRGGVNRKWKERMEGALVNKLSVGGSQHFREESPLRTVSGFQQSQRKGVGGWKIKT